EYGVNSGIYKSDGTTAGTVLLKDINPNGNAFLHDLMGYNGKLYFRGVGYGTDSDSLWTSDGTTAGTLQVATFGWRNGGEGYRHMIVAGGKLWLGANDPAIGSLPVVYVSDGTAAGTAPVMTSDGGLIGEPQAFFGGQDVVYVVTS